MLGSIGRQENASEASSVKGISLSPCARAGNSKLDAVERPAAIPLAQLLL